MPTDRIELLRILSNLDQAIAKVARTIEREQTYDGWQVSMDARDKLERAEKSTLAALRKRIQE